MPKTVAPALANRAALSEVFEWEVLKVSDGYMAAWVSGAAETVDYFG